MARRRFTDVSLMIRSEVGVTRRDEPAVESVSVRVPSRLDFTSLSECLLAETDFLGRFVISESFMPAEMILDTQGRQ